MTKLVSQQNTIIVKDNLVVGKLPNTKENDILIYNRKQTDKKLKEISTSDKAEMTEITKTIAQWGYALGITVVAQDLITLNNFVRENFPSLNIFDLKVCVKLVSIDSDLLETDAEHYGKLTMIYVSKVLKAYETYKSKICFGVRENILKLEQSVTPTISKEERLKNFKVLLSNAKSTVGSGGLFDDLGEVVYNFIRYNKLVKIDQALIDKAMDWGESEFKNSLKEYRRVNLKSMIKDASYSETKKEDIIKRGARRYVANFWISNMDLPQTLKNLTFEMLLY
jgi:hypothetical protein